MCVCVCLYVCVYIHGLLSSYVYGNFMQENGCLKILRNMYVIIVCVWERDREKERVRKKEREYVYTYIAGVDS